MKTTINVLLLGLMIFFQSCDPKFDELQIHNYSGQAIYRFYTCSDTIDALPELALFETFERNGKKELSAPIYRIPAYEYKPILMWGLTTFIKDCDKSTIKIFFIREKTMKEKRWTEIVQGQLYIKKMELSVEDLEKLDWVVTYQE